MKYRIIKKTFYDGRNHYVPQAKILFFWFYLSFYNRLTCIYNYENTLNDAKAKIILHKAKTIKSITYIDVAILMPTTELNHTTLEFLEGVEALKNHEPLHE